jgi:hypothetical protein
MMSCAQGVLVEEHMDRQELTALRDILDLILELPDNVRDQVAAWLAPAKPNGHDPHPIAAAKGSKLEQSSTATTIAEIRHPARPARPAPYAGKVRLGRPQTSPKAASKNAENKLLTALSETPGLSMNALAKAAGVPKSSTGERLRQLAARGVVTKDADGRWRLVAELAGEQPDPTQPPAAAS